MRDEISSLVWSMTISDNWFGQTISSTILRRASICFPSPVMCLSVVDDDNDEISQKEDENGDENDESDCENCDESVAED